jgi:hypothetical protein
LELEFKDLEQSFFWYLKSAGNSQFNISIAHEEGMKLTGSRKIFVFAEEAANVNDFHSCLSWEVL